MHGSIFFAVAYICRTLLASPSDLLLEDVNPEVRPDPEEIKRIEAIGFCHFTEDKVCCEGSRMSGGPAMVFGKYTEVNCFKFDIDNIFCQYIDQIACCRFFLKKKPHEAGYPGSGKADICKGMAESHKDKEREDDGQHEQSGYHKKDHAKGGSTSHVRLLKPKLRLTPKQKIKVPNETPSSFFKFDWPWKWNENREKLFY